MEILTLEELIDHCYGIMADSIATDIANGSLSHISLYVDASLSVAKILQIKRPQEGVYGKIGVYEISLPTESELAFIRVELEKRFKALADELLSEDSLFQQRLQLAEKHIGELVQEYHGSYIIHRAYANATFNFMASFDEMGYHGLKMYLGPKADIISKCEAWRHALEQHRNARTEEDKAKMISSIYMQTMSSILEQELEDSEFTASLSLNAYNHHHIDCLLDYKGAKVFRKTIDLNRGMQNEIDSVVSLCKHISRLLSVIDQQILQLTFKESYSIELRYGIESLDSTRISVSRQPDYYLFSIEVPSDNSSFDEIQTIKSIEKKLSLSDIFDQIVDSIDPSGYATWTMHFYNESIYVSKSNISRFIKFKDLSKEFDTLSDSLKKTLTTIFNEYHFKTLIQAESKEIFQEKLSSIYVEMDIENMRANLNYKFISLSYYVERSVDLTLDVHEQIESHYKQVFFDSDSLEDKIISSLKDLPVKCQVSNNQSQYYTVRVSIPNMPAIVRNIHKDNRMDKEMTELVSAVTNKLRMLHLI